MLLEKKPVRTASRPVVWRVGLPGSSEETTPRRFLSSVRSQRSRPKMLTFVSGLTIAGDGVALAGDGLDEGGFAAAVGAEDGDVLAGVDGEVDVVEDDVVAAGYVDVSQMQERWHSFLGYRRFVPMLILIPKREFTWILG